MQSHLLQLATSLLALPQPLAVFASVLTLSSGRKRREQQATAVQAAMAFAAIMVASAAQMGLHGLRAAFPVLAERG
ncbi:MAG: hypothetical protein ACK46L_16920 [Synechococcaceae cyanobacterium]